MPKYKLIAVGVGKKDIPKIKRDLKKAGYSGFKSIKKGKYYDLFYTKAQTRIYLRGKKKLKKLA